MSYEFRFAWLVKSADTLGASWFPEVAPLET